MDIQAEPERAPAPLVKRAPQQQPSMAAPSSVEAAHPGQGAEIFQVRAADRHELYGPHDAAPIPPTLGQGPILSAVDDDHQIVLPAFPESPCGEGESGVWVSLRPIRRPFR